MATSQPDQWRTPAVNMPPRHLLAPKHWLTWAGIGLFGLLAWLPWQARRGLGKWLGNWIYRRNRKRHTVVLSNLRLCFPTLSDTQHEQMAQAHLQEYASALLDYSVLFFRSRRWLYQRTQIIGREHIDQAIAAGQNVILMLGHSVWLEFAPAAIGEHYRAYGSYKPFHNPVADWLIARSRLQDVEFVVAREEGMMKLVRALEPGRLMFFLPDEDHGSKHSVFAPFFGVPKATLTTPARLAKLGKAVALPVMAFFNPQRGGYEIVIGAALTDYPGKDEEQNATLLNTGLQILIEQHPEQYMWVLKFFRTRPTNETDVY
ncbi:lysophospholipid acyltransferase family protein [Thiothrix lacustris]|uniref:Lysophospholipid acyltransferase family protein n=1 Tax=Thiothrix lacustris TaxID=525917 RepID=A0ABY9MUG1_9GAMM|nr:lysophospholipid acyltransferase family protein [Thiothrix lacustris]WML91800.1 lysophospholipid acyltransferase family protein [Thiothrix lacustris]